MNHRIITAIKRSQKLYVYDFVQQSHSLIPSTCNDEERIPLTLESFDVFVSMKYGNQWRGVRLIKES